MVKLYTFKKQENDEHNIQNSDNSGMGRLGKLGSGQERKHTDKFH